MIRSKFCTAGCNRAFTPILPHTIVHPHNGKVINMCPRCVQGINRLREASQMSNNWSPSNGNGQDRKAA